jgi:hypothetical protein
MPLPNRSTHYCARYCHFTGVPRPNLLSLYILANNAGLVVILCLSGSCKPPLLDDLLPTATSEILQVQWPLFPLNPYFHISVYPLMNTFFLILKPGSIESYSPQLSNDYFCAAIGGEMLAQSSHSSSGLPSGARIRLTPSDLGRFIGRFP